ncbi:uncharacterized protein CPUR_06240 [Claviceps purpurea 20.1]|uniref:Uncharacterized protein n=1 Tax=Claviceps purpurea (strain 20.1) TaxID=1111077 RepID=M1W9B4_CLAP2|nr:uncharacterized protein CPUR_06240 [Claviceps purpurea 20.1]
MGLPIVIIALVYWPLPVSLYIDVYSFIQRPLAVVLRVWHASNKFATADEMQGYSIASFTNSHGGILPLPHQGHASVLDFRHLLTDLLFHVSSLFVEPAKSVPSNKVSFKDGATSPSYGESRHPSSRSEISDRRNGLRRANVRIYGPMQRAMRNSHDQLHQNRHLPWIDAPREQDRADYSAADPLPRTFRGSQEALRDMTRTNESRGEPVEEWTDPIIRNYWRDSPPPLSQVTGEPDSMTEALELGWWPFEAPVPTTRSGRLERPALTMPHGEMRSIPSHPGDRVLRCPVEHLLAWMYHRPTSNLRLREKYRIFVWQMRPELVLEVFLIDPHGVQQEASMDSVTETEA